MNSALGVIDRSRAAPEAATKWKMDSNHFLVSSFQINIKSLLHSYSFSSFLCLLRAMMNFLLQVAVEMKFYTSLGQSLTHPGITAPRGGGEVSHHRALQHWALSFSCYEGSTPHFCLFEPNLNSLTFPRCQNKSEKIALSPVNLEPDNQATSQDPHLQCY